jgi:hypothetical protein
MTKRRKSYFAAATVVTLALLVVGLLASGVASAVLRAYVGADVLPTTEQNVDARISRWVDANGAEAVRVESPGSRFCYRVTTPGHFKFTVDQFEDERELVNLTAGLALTVEQERVFKQLPESERQWFIAQLAKKLGDIKVVYVSFEGSESVCVQERIPVTAQLDEATFMAEVDKLQSGLRFVALNVHQWLESEASFDPDRTEWSGTEHGVTSQRKSFHSAEAQPFT